MGVRRPYGSSLVAQQSVSSGQNFCAVHALPLWLAAITVKAGRSHGDSGSIRTCGSSTSGAMENRPSRTGRQPMLR